VLGKPCFPYRFGFHWVINCPYSESGACICLGNFQNFGKGRFEGYFFTFIKNTTMWHPKCKRANKGKVSLEYKTTEMRDSGLGRAFFLGHRESKKRHLRLNEKG
jgi:hypothetical protein